ncbi:hypothetical protein VP01_1325g2 [Puccinia sorghi]|uniref:Uncharacterized protein n=1 Tax=Puccinia sorghi TaxID=27349 RepID=A0A0L6VPC2_9BASI|nr:hypothetical protein VP01_1325g2 [Puccinia sorghi]
MRKIKTPFKTLRFQSYILAKPWGIGGILRQVLPVGVSTAGTSSIRLECGSAAATGKDPSNQAVPSETPNQNTSGDTDHQTTSGNDNKTQPAPGPQPASTPNNTNLTIVLNVNAQIEVINMQQNKNKGGANWQKAKSMQNITPIQHDLYFERASCSYASCIKTISSLGKSKNTIILYSLLMIFSPSANEFLGPTTSDPWYCPNIINFPTICSHAEKEKQKAPPHNPPSTEISHWAKVVAVSVKLMADNLYMPPPPEVNSSLTFETSDNNPAPNQEFIEWPHTVDVLNNLGNFIINIFMGYIIIQINALSFQPLTNSEKKKTYHKKGISACKANNSSQALIEQGNTLSQPEQKKSKISQIRDKCLWFACAISIIKNFSRTPQIPEEPIWKNLLAYLVKLFQTSFLSSDNILPLAKPPVTGYMKLPIMTSSITGDNSNAQAPS